MIAEIARIRGKQGNVIIIVKELCESLDVEVTAGREVFNSIDNTSPSNTRRGREEGRERAIEILRKMAVLGEEVNFTELGKQAGLSYNMASNVYCEMKGKMPLPPIKKKKRSART